MTKRQVGEKHPVKQGLKLYIVGRIQSKSLVGEKHPLKQGLKETIANPFFVANKIKETRIKG